MTLEEAIKHCEEVALRKDIEMGCKECAAEHSQLAAWLKELKKRRTETHACDYGKKETHGDVIYRKDAIAAISVSAFSINTVYGRSERGMKALQDAVMALKALPSAEPEQVRTQMSSADCISRQAAIDALWKALYDYEDKTEKQFIESDELDVYDWIKHRTFVQNMSDIDRQTILELPSAEPEIIRCKDCEWWEKQKDSVQGRCALMQMYPAGGWYCGNAQRRKNNEA